MQILNSLASEMVSAKWQCQILYTLRDQLTERELKVCKRARNAHVHVPKSATVEEYREATAFEGLLGYLRLSGQEERLHTICLLYTSSPDVIRHPALRSSDFPHALRPAIIFSARQASISFPGLFFKQFIRFLSQTI